MRTHIGKPIPFDPSLTPEALAHRVSCMKSDIFMFSRTPKAFCCKQPIFLNRLLYSVLTLIA